MKRLKRWAVLRLTQPEIREVRRMYGVDWILTTVEHSRSMYEPGQLILHYTSQFEYLRDMTVTAKDLES